MARRQLPPGGPQSGTLTERILRRVAMGLVIATVGVLAGTLAAPTLRQHYYLRRLRSDDAAVRLEALNELAGIAQRTASVAAPLIDGLLTEGDQPNGVSSETVERVAAWAIERSPAVHSTVGALLASTDADRFTVLANWLEQAGRWSPDYRTMEALARREVIRLSAGNSAQCRSALEALERLGPAAGAYLAESLATTLSDPDDAVGEATVRTAAACLDTSQAVDLVLLPALAAASAGVRRAAVIQLGLLRPAALGDRASEPADPALLWALRGTDAGRDRALEALAGADPNRRRMAAWVLGTVSPGDRATVAALLDLLDDADAVVVARAAVALGRLAAELDDVSSLIRTTTANLADARLGALYALGRCATGVEARRAAAAGLRDTLGVALRTGDVASAMAAMESLGRLGDEPFLQVMLDAADEFSDEPMLQYAAACAALDIDREAGIRALLEVCGADLDEVRELAAYRISRVASPPAECLRRALLDGGEPLRGGAALALALSGTCELYAGEGLADWLADRFDPANAEFERAWPIRSNYLGARLVCGDPEARGELDLYLLNRHVSRMGLYVALLETGRTLPLDMLLGKVPSVDPHSFLHAVRFGEVLADYFPNAPTASWFEDSEIRGWQVDRLRDWWRINRFHTRLDPARRWYAVESGR